MMNCGSRAAGEVLMQPLDGPTIVEIGLRLISGLTTMGSPIGRGPAIPRCWSVYVPQPPKERNYNLPEFAHCCTINIESLVLLCSSGVCDRYPKLRFAVAESEIPS